MNGIDEYKAIEISSFLFPYSIHGDLKKNRNKVLVLLSGFPDDNITGFGKESIDHFAQDYFVICLCLPGYATKPPRYWGYDFCELVKMMNDTIASILSTDNNTTKFYLIGHDWGAYVCQLYENKYPQDIVKLCLLDVALTKDTKKSLVSVFYQTWLAVSFIVSQTLGAVFGQIIIILLIVIFRIIPSLSPTPHDKPYRPRNEISPNFCYPYYYLWRNILYSYLFPSSSIASILAPKFPSCPTLYMYGACKNTMFHGPSIIKHLKDTPGSSYISLNCGHWLQRHQQDIFWYEIDLFFKETLLSSSSDSTDETK